MNYPLISEYIEAIKSAEDNFDELNYLRPVLDNEGQPVMTSGNFAVVFKMKDERDGKFYAVKCFIREQEGRTEAYKLIAEELENVDSPYLVPIRFLERELFVDTQQTGETEFPVLLMDWVDGQPLDKYLRENIYNQNTRRWVYCIFCLMADWLIQQPFAHGDLKPDNILVREDGSLVLVDYDGMYVPAMKGQKARELGSPDFRHPLRTEADFNAQIDDFSIATILLSIKAIVISPNLINKCKKDSSLLLHVDDYVNQLNTEIGHSILELKRDNKDLDRIYLLFMNILTNNTLYRELYNEVIQTNWEENTEFIHDWAKKVCHEGEGENLFLSYHLFYQLSLRGFEESRVCLSCCLMKGYGCIKNEKIGFLMRYDSAQKGNRRAQRVLGSSYRWGWGVQKDLEKAVEWYTKAAEQGDVTAQYNLGICYFCGKGVDRDEKKAVEWYTKAAEQGDVDAQYSLGKCYYYGRGVEEDFEKAMEWNAKAVKQGHTKAQEIMFTYYGQLAQLLLHPKHIDAQYNLGICYYCGKGVDRDEKKAVKWYTEAAEQGYARAQCSLGYCYEYGKGVEQDLEKAVEWYTKAATHGNVTAQTKLGSCYYFGIGVQKDKEKAVEWYTKAAEQGYARAQHILGSCYDCGGGVEQDLEKAVEWYTKAAEQGDVGAQYDLGVCYEYGQGVQKDLEKAVEWYTKAVEKGCKISVGFKFKKLSFFFMRSTMT